MKSKLGAVALAGGMLMAGTANAEDPTNVAKVIEQIEARRAAKAAEEAKSQINYQEDRSGRGRLPFNRPEAAG